MIHDIKSLRRKIDDIEVNIKIYKRDLEKKIKQLKEMGIDEVKSIPTMLERIQEDNKLKTNKKQKYLSKANEKITKVEDA